LHSLIRTLPTIIIWKAWFAGKRMDFHRLTDQNLFRILTAHALELQSKPLTYRPMPPGQSGQPLLRFAAQPKQRYRSGIIPEFKNRLSSLQPAASQGNILL